VSNLKPVTSREAPAAIGPYSQAVRAGNTVYLSGQIPLDPKTMELVQGDISVQATRVFDNLAAVAKAAGGTLAHCAKVNIFLTDLGHFAAVNEVMKQYFSEPYPARACVGVASLPRGAAVEIEAIMVLND
jgi:reactive intermediate/imine deaminase